MKVFRRKSAVSLDDRLTGLGEAVEAAEGRLPDDVVEQARAVIERAGVRRSLSVDHTVVALAGATGSGKSSLFNLLSGTLLAEVGVTRPTTSTAQAATWNGAGTAPLLDWLQIPHRHELTPGPSPAALSDADSDAPPSDVTPADAALSDAPASGFTRSDVASVSPADAPPPVAEPVSPRGPSATAPGASTQTTPDPDFSGLVLLDLPDHDSIRLSHRLEVDRLVTMVDLLVWVVDPQKYADALLHERYLRPLARHRDVMVIVLNQIDRLTPSAAERCLTDLRRLLAEDELSGVPVIGVSTRTGAGVPELRATLVERVSKRRSWTARLAADAETAADSLVKASHGAPAEAEVPPERLQRPLTAALAEAAGVPLVVAAVAKAHRHRSVVATGWPVTRWLRRFRPDPLRRLRLGGIPETEPEAVGRTSIPAASGVQRSRVDTAIRDLAQSASAGLPDVWAAAVRQAARSHAGDLPDRLDRTVAATSYGAARRPRWWRAVGLLQWLVFALMVAGALWLAGLFALDYLRLPELPSPTLGEVPWPTVSLVGGALVGLVIALLSRGVAWLGGRRRARKTAKSLHAEVGQVGRELVVAPVEAELDRYRRFTEAVALARRE
ncbi:GTPase [Streptosporangium soli]|nr:50S ribosome-binding GTPase [Streptosporangium sp. KLBMP 9127]